MGYYITIIILIQCGVQLQHINAQYIYIYIYIYILESSIKLGYGCLIYQCCQSSIKWQFKALIPIYLMLARHVQMMLIQLATYLTTEGVRTHYVNCERCSSEDNISSGVHNDCIMTEVRSFVSWRRL